MNAQNSSIREEQGDVLLVGSGDARPARGGGSWPLGGAASKMLLDGMGRN